MIKRLTSYRRIEWSEAALAAGAVATCFAGHEKTTSWAAVLFSCGAYSTMVSAAFLLDPPSRTPRGYSIYPLSLIWAGFALSFSFLGGLPSGLLLTSLCLTAIGVVLILLQLLGILRRGWWFTQVRGDTTP